MEETLGSFPCLDRKVGPCGVSDEKRVAGEHDPGVRPAGEVGDGDAAVLGTMPWRVDAAEDDVSECDLRAVLEGVVRVLGLSSRMNAHGDAVLEREPPVTGEMVGVRVRLDDADDPDLAPLSFPEVLLDREGRVDDDAVTGTRVADEIRSTPERVVDELREDHDARPYQRLPLFLLKWVAQTAVQYAPLGGAAHEERRRQASIASATTNSTPMSATTPARARFCDGLSVAGVIVSATGQETTPPSA